MADRAWKEFERKVARYFGGKRRGPAPDQGQHTKRSCAGSDVMHENLLIECKQRGKPHYGWQEYVRLGKPDAMQHGELLILTASYIDELAEDDQPGFKKLPLVPVKEYKEINDVFSEVTENAIKDGKIPVICTHLKAHKNFLVIFDSLTLDAVIQERRIANQKAINEYS